MHELWFCPSVEPTITFFLSFTCRRATCKLKVQNSKKNVHIFSKNNSWTDRLLQIHFRALLQIQKYRWVGVCENK